MQAGFTGLAFPRRIRFPPLRRADVRCPGIRRRQLAPRRFGDRHRHSVPYLALVLRREDEDEEFVDTIGVAAHGP